MLVYVLLCDNGSFGVYLEKEKKNKEKNISQLLKIWLLL